MLYSTILQYELSNFPSLLFEIGRNPPPPPTAFLAFIWISATAEKWTFCTVAKIYFEYDLTKTYGVFVSIYCYFDS